jgi:hypothetical protein
MGIAVEDDRLPVDIMAEEEFRAVVFVCDRKGAALSRRERCLKLAGLVHRVEAERRPSGTYYKLTVRECDAVAAHLALQMGGCARSSRLRQDQSSIGRSIREIAHTLWEEALLLVGRVKDFLSSVTPKLLTGPTRSNGRSEP